MTAETESTRQTEVIPTWKHEEVEELVGLIEEYESVGVVDITGIPSRQLQNMRADLYGTAQVRMSRNTLLVRALEAVDDGVEALIPYIGGQVGLVGTNVNSFGLFRELEASKTPAPINAGEVAPNDIVIPAGDTGIDPGPFVGELQQVGADARIEGGSIQVKSDSTVAESGDVVSAQLANVLSELEIEPKEVGLDLRAVYADGILFEPDELAIDLGRYRDDVSTAATTARTLSVEAGIPTARTIPALLRRATGAAKSVGVSARIEDPSILPELVSQADAQLRTLVSQIDDVEALPDDLQEVAQAAAAPSESTPDDTEEATDDTDPESADEPEDDDHDDDDGGAEGLGEMFG